jgi:preprotein translocase subunit SecA
VYTTCQEVGFDYLRDRLTAGSEDQVIVSLGVLIIDEADSILIDEATVPLVLSGVGRNETHILKALNQVADRLQEGRDFEVQRDVMAVTITESGYDMLESSLNAKSEMGKSANSLYADVISMMDGVVAVLTARHIYREDKEYLLKDNQIVIVDEHTGRAQEGRRWSNMIHQALEFKHGLEVQSEPPTLATASISTIVHRFKAIAGISGTAALAKEELATLYNIDVKTVSPRIPSIRIDAPRRMYRTQESKWDAIIEVARKASKRGQPVLIGTGSVDESEAIARKLQSVGVEHALLNARTVVEETKIIARAGAPGMITVATQMAGRGTDILLGGNPDERPHEALAIDRQAALNAGGLLVIGASCSMSRRVDEQMKGRSGRQGEPGATIFFSSVEDELIREYAGNRIRDVLDKMDVADQEGAEGALVERLVLVAQRKREQIDEDMRRDLFRYDEIIRQQMDLFYHKRAVIAEGIKAMPSGDNEYIVACFRAAAEDLASRYPEIAADMDRVCRDIAVRWNLKMEPGMVEKVADAKGLKEALVLLASQYGAFRLTKIKAELVPAFLLHSTLEGLDREWSNHLEEIQYLRKSVGLRTIANENPRIAFQKASYELFDGIFDEAVRHSGSVLLGVFIPEPAQA